MPTIEEFQLWCMFQEAYDPAMFHLAMSAWWTTYHEVTLCRG